MSGYFQVNTSDPEASDVMRNHEDVTFDPKLPPQDGACKVYKIRWLILFMFVLYSAISLMQWIQYSVIADVVVKYYGISYETSNWTTLVYLLLYIPFLFPGSYLLQKLGLRTSILLGMFLTCAGAWIKVASVEPNRFWVLILGQSVVAVSHVLILPVSPRIAAVWFGPKQVSSACSIGIFGIQLGIAVGFLIPPLMVNNQGNEQDIGRSLQTMAIAVAVACSVLLVILFIFFKGEPPSPPSLAQLKIKENKEDSITFMQSLKKLLSSAAYLQLLFAYGINLGIFCAVSALLNQIILNYYPGASRDVGIIGLVTTFAGMTGSIALGVMLDKFKKFKETTIGVYLVALGGMIAFSFGLDKGLEIVYVLMTLLGFSLAGFKSVAFEVAAELTYPIPEGTSGGILTVASQVLGIVFTYLYSFLFYNTSHVWANIAMCVVIFVGLILVVSIRYDLRRHAAQNANCSSG